MHLLDLPVEIVSLIFTYLDIKSKLNTYALYELRHFFAPCLMKKVDITRSTLTSVESLNLEMFHNFASHIQELNLSGVQDLSADKLSPCIRRFTSLKTLDVTFTQITLSDLENICCDTLKNISVNFIKCPLSNIGETTHWEQDESWTPISNFFIRQQFERIHFLLPLFDFPESPLKFMRCVPLTKDLKITAECLNLAFPERNMESIDIHFEKLCYILRLRGALAFEEDYIISRYLNGISNLDYTKIEYIFIRYSKRKQVTFIYASPIFRSILMENFSGLEIKISPNLPLNFKLTGHGIFKAWNKIVTIFNESFFKDLLSELLDYFPTYFCTCLHTLMQVTETPNRSCCIDCCGDFDELPNLPEYVSISNLCMCRRYRICDSPITMKPTMNSFKNVAFLRLMNICFKRNFFALLFMQCEMLCTLDLEFSEPVEPPSLNQEHCMVPMLNSLHLLKNLKNLKVMSGDIPYRRLFDSLCIRATLENLYVCEPESYSERFQWERSDSLIIVKCCNLNSLFIESTTDLEELQFFWQRDARILRKEYIHITVRIGYGWNPFADMFNPSPLFITHDQQLLQTYDHMDMLTGYTNIVL